MPERTTAKTVTVELGQLARAAVLTAAPDQIDLFTAATARWDAGAGRRGGTGGSVGSGIEPVLLAEVIGQVLLGAVAEVLGAATVAAWGRRRRWFRRRRDARPGPATRVTLDADQAEAVRAACVRHATTLGLGPAEATMLADAVHGALCQALAEADPVDE